MIGDCVLIKVNRKIFARNYRTLTFDISNDDHDEETMVVGVVSVVYTCGDLTSANDFLRSNQHKLDGQESHTLVEEVQRAVKDEVPGFVMTQKGMVRDKKKKNYCLEVMTESCGSSQQRRSWSAIEQVLCRKIHSEI